MTLGVQCSDTSPTNHFLSDEGAGAKCMACGRMLHCVICGRFVRWDGFWAHGNMCKNPAFGMVGAKAVDPATVKIQFRYQVW